MADTPSAPVRNQPSGPARTEPRPESTGPVLVEDDLLVEEISIDGMCGVY